MIGTHMEINYIKMLAFLPRGERINNSINDVGALEHPYRKKKIICLTSLVTREMKSHSEVLFSPMIHKKSAYQELSWLMGNRVLLVGI